MNNHSSIFRPALLLRTNYILLISFVCLAFLWSCNSGKSTVPDKVIYAMPATIAAMPAYIALEKGFWKQEGLNVEAKMFSSGRQALDAVLAKSAEIVSVSETPLMLAILKGNPIYIVTTVTEHQEVKLIVRTDHGILQPADLKGKKVASLPGTNSDYFMDEFLKKNNIRKGDITVINLQPPAMVTALINGDIDAYFAWEPHIYYSKSKIPNQTKIFPPGDLYTGRHCVALNQDYVESHPEVVEKLIRGFVRAEKFIRENPEEAFAITAKITGVPQEEVKSLAAEYHPDVELDSTLLNILVKEGRWASQAHDSAANVRNFKDHIYIKGMQKVKPESVTIAQ